MRHYKKVKLIAGLGAGALLTLSSSAHAAFDASGIILDIAPVEVMMLTIMTGLAAMWGFRKLIKTVNRS